MRLACAMATTMASLSPTRTILGRVAPLTMLASTLATRNPPNSFRLVALDMDGTVLNKEHTLSDASLERLRTLSARGIIIALCSGRSNVAIEAHAAHLSLDRPLPVVAFNGACGLLAEAPGYTKGASELFTTPVPSDAVSKVLEVCDKAGLLVQYYVGDDIIVHCKTDEHMELTKRYAALTGVPAHVYCESYEEGLARGAPYKLLVMGDTVDANLELLQNELPDGIAKLVRGSPPFFVEVLHPDVDKGEGLKRMAEALGVPMSEVVAFGDGDNDIEFVQAAGLGVAMANARPTLKAVADRITQKTNDEDGVAYELEELERSGQLQLPAPRAVYDGLDICRVEPQLVVGLREMVLWPGKPEMCVLPEDDKAFHLGAVPSLKDGQAVEPVGVLSLFMSEDGETAQFRKLATHPEYRSRGIGSALVSTAAAEARLAGAKTLVCDARQKQSGFYERLGFSKEGEPFSKYGEELYVRMVRSL